MLTEFFCPLCQQTRSVANAGETWRCLNCNTPMVEKAQFMRASGGFISAGKTDRKHSHYFHACPYDQIDVYRVLLVFGVTDPCLQHAAKKLLKAGGRGQKDAGQDVQEAIDTLRRWQEMRAEEA